MGADKRGEGLKKLNRCRLKLELMLLLDGTIANGRQLEQWMMLPKIDGVGSSRFTFPRKVPTKSDWVYLANFWQEYTDPGLYLPAPPGHRVAE